MRRLFVAALLLAGPTARAADPPPDVSAAITTILNVSAEGSGNEPAAAAWAKLVAAGPAALVPTLAAFDAAPPTAANWLRTAVDAVAERERKANRKLPADVLAAFVRDTKRNPTARRIAFELYSAEAKDDAAKLLPTLIDDPSTEIRRDAIEARLKAAPEGSGGKPELQTLFVAARDKDQVEEVAKRLGELGDKPDLTKHFGYVTEWLVAGPFDSPGGSGFGKPFPPEAGVDPAAKYTGKAGAAFGWKSAQSSAVYGTVDLNTDLGKHKDAAAYAFAVLTADRETPAELRVASQNSIELFVNGKRVFGRDEYHHGTRMDQHVAKVVLRPGRNEVLVKVLQNDQKESWAQAWAFALRVCAATGGRLPLTQVVTKDGAATTVSLGNLKAEPKEEK